MNLTITDLALVELHCDGTTAAPADVVQRLRDKDLVRRIDGKFKLTSAGRRRAERLKDLRPTLEKMFASTPGRCQFTTAAGPSIR